MGIKTVNVLDTKLERIISRSDLHKITVSEGREITTYPGNTEVTTAVAVDAATLDESLTLLTLLKCGSRSERKEDSESKEDRFGGELHD